MPQPVLLGGRPLERWEPPETLPADGREFWVEVVGTLAELGAIDRVDRFALEGAATAWARARQAGRVLAAQGLAVEGSMGQIVEHPMAATERASLALVLRFAEQYGLTMLARTRLGLAELQRRSLAEELRDLFGADPGEPPAPAGCEHCGAPRGRRHADGCPRRRRPRRGR